MSVIRTSDTPSTDRAAPTREGGDVRRLPANAEAVDRFRSLMQQRGDAQNQAAPEGDHAPQAGVAPTDAGAGAPVATPSADAAQADARAQLDALKWQAFERHDEQRRDDAFAAATPVPGHVGTAQVPTPPPPQAGANASSVAELIDRHVRQLAVTEGRAGQGDDGVFLRLSDDTLPGTDLLLTRTPDGWALQADVRSRSSFEAIRDAAPELARRFAARNLGTLVVDPQLRG